MNVERAFVAVLGRLPLGLNRAFGAAIGWTVWRLRAPHRRVTEINLALCRRQDSAAERAALTRASLVETGRMLAELAWIWSRPPERVRRRIVEVRGEALLRSAERDRRGLLIVAPHLGTWELGTLSLSPDSAPLALYSSAARTSFEAAAMAGRARLGIECVPFDRSGLKRALGTLRDGGTLCLLPDQEAPRGQGVFVPFFGIAANTMTLPGTLTRRSGARVLVWFVERLPGGRGWRAHYVEPDEGVYDARPAVAAAAMNRSLERCIERLPAQYLWSHPRFSLLPGRRRRLYDAPPAPPPSADVSAATTSECPRRGRDRRRAPGRRDR